MGSEQEAAQGGRTQAASVREPLSKDAIVTRAVEIVDAEGADALSMRRLGKEFGVAGMALYHHFPNKQAILDAVVARVVADAAGGELPPPGPDWRKTMRTGILAVHRALEAHPNVAPLVTKLTPESVAALTWVEGPLAILASAGFDGRALVAAYHQILAYTFGWHLMAANDTGGLWRDASASCAPAAELAPTASRLAGVLGDWSFGFEEGLDMVLDGVEARRG